MALNQMVADFEMSQGSENKCLYIIIIIIIL